MMSTSICCRIVQAFLGVISVLCGCALAQTGSPGPALAALLPQEAEGWRATGADGLYDADSLFTYIDGAAEIYRSFHVKRVAARKYAKAGAPDINADLYDMGDSKDAYGVYHHERRPGAGAGLGQESELLENSVAFWKGRYFVSVMAMDSTPESRQGVIEVARRIDAAIVSKGAIPGLIERLPQKDLMKTETFYFHDSLCLGIHYPLGEGNPFELRGDTEGVVAKYAAAGAAPQETPTVLLWVRYPTAERAQQAGQSVLKSCVAEADGKGTGKTENGRFAAVRTAGREVISIFDAPSREAAEELLLRVPGARTDAGGQPSSCK